MKIDIPAGAREMLQDGRKGETVSLAGQWKCRLDPERRGLVEDWQTKDFELPIKLPGSLDTAGYGDVTDQATLANLHKKRTFIGPAWYQREIEIPDRWSGKQISLLLERVMWESRVWVDGQAVGLQDSLSTPHHYDLGALLTPGRHRLTIRVDNSGRPGPNAHGYGDDIQPKWNGIIGRMELSARDPVFIDTLSLEPDLENKQVRVRAMIVNTTGAAYDGVLRLRARLRGGAGSPFPAKEISVRVNSPETRLMADYPMTDAVPWDEFSPTLYEMEAGFGAQLAEKDAKNRPATVNDVSTEIFGMRSFKANGTRFSWNGRTTMLRGNHDAMGFPLTGYPAMDVESWIRIYQTLKAYGLNHVRFHSVCPPEAAFTAADLEGIIVQAELPAWGEIKETAAGTAFLRAELFRILKAYGNHPSFALMAMGNEHSGDWTVLGDFVDQAKRLDSRRLYAASSNEYIRKGPGLINPGDDFSAIMWGNGKGEERLRYFDDWVLGASPQPASDFKQIINQFPVPVMSHELGQYWIFPNLKEIDSYQGVMQPGALKIFRKRLTTSGLIKDAPALSAASGALSVAIYKEEIEKMFRTGNIGGFQLLDLHDYSGQNTSLVGILDSFWNTKGLITPEQWRRFCSPSVVVARLPKFVFAPSDRFDVPVEIAHYGPVDMKSVRTQWSLSDYDGKTVVSGEIGGLRDIPTGGSTSLGNIQIDLTQLPQVPGRYRLEIKVTDVTVNDWNIWLLPEATVPQPGDIGSVTVTESMDSSAWDKLRSGGTVVWLGSGATSAVPVNFVNALWNPWTEGSVKTCGLFIDPAHPAMNRFPTASHGDWQWFDLLPLTARGFVMNDFPAELSIPIQGIDNPMRAFRIGLLWEAKVGKGTFIATSLDLTKDLGQRPAAAQFRRSLMTYAASGKARPAASISEDQARRLVEGDRFGILTSERSLVGATLDVQASANLKEPNRWSQTLDGITVRENGFDYAVEQNENARRRTAPDVSRRSDAGDSWTGRDFQIRITTPEAFTGDVFLLLKSGSAKASAILEAGRAACYLGDHAGNGKWVRIRVLPADQGTTVVKIYPPAGAEAPHVTRLVVLRHQ